MALILINVIQDILNNIQEVFNRQSDTLRNANAGGTVTFESYNSKNI